MLSLLGWVILISAILVPIFFRLSLITSTFTIFIALVVLSLLSIWSWWILVPLCLVFLIYAVILNWLPLRRKLLSNKIALIYRRLLPRVSETERIASEAGDVWWEGELFQGNPNWKKLFNMPVPQLTAEEKSFIDNQVETLCSMLNDWDIVQENDLPEEVWNYIKTEGFWGLAISKEFGGKGFSAYAQSVIITKIATRSYSAAISIMVPNSLGPAELLQLYGTTEQQQFYLPRLAVGEEVPCFALTATEAGSDATSMPDKGIVCKGKYNGQEVIGIRLNFDKRYITLAPISTLMGLAFRLFDPDHILGKEEEIGITLCLLPTDLPGVEIGARHMPLHTGFLNGPARGKDVFIPLDFVIGGPAMLGKGWYILMDCLSIGRGISLPALSTAIGKLSLRTTSAYAGVRRQFNMPIGKLEGVQEALARIGGFTYLCESARIMTASALNQDVKPSLASAITKYHLTELARKIINHAMDVHGGKAIQLGPKNYIGLFYESMPINITVEGANILTRNLIIFGQGALRCHPFIQREMAAVMNDNREQGMIEFDKLIFNHFGYNLSHLLRTFVYGLTGGKWIAVPNIGPITRYCRQLTRMSTALAAVADIVMVKLGGELKRKERLSARLGDVLSYLYLASGVLYYFNFNGQPKSDVPWVTWALQWCLARIQIAFDELLANFPNRWLARILHWLIFPYGRSYQMPSDELSTQIAEDMLQLSSLRDRLTEYCYIGNDEEVGILGLERAFRTMIAAEPIQTKLQKAVRSGQLPKHASIEEQAALAIKAGILTPEELQLLLDYQALHTAAIQVDEFKSTTMARKRRYGSRKS